MELFRSESHYIFVRDESSLWWDRITGAFSVKSAWDLSCTEDIECLGITEGIIGKVEHSNIYEPRLMIIKESAPVGQLYFNHSIYKIKSVCFLNLGPTNTEIDLSPCTKHGAIDRVHEKSKKGSGKLFEGSAFINKTIGAVKTAGFTIKNTTQQAATQVKQTVIKKTREVKIDDRFDKRLTDELQKIFNDSDSFYFSRTLDITNSLQRQYENEKKLEDLSTNKPVTDIKKWWKYVDDRFFWNRHMLEGIIALGSPDCDPWILPIIQGFVQLSQIVIEPSDGVLNTESLAGNSSNDEMFTLGIISRRSRYQAGTRYNRRGVDSSGKVANYVETEQIVSVVCSDCIHRASFVQVRGSVPIFWSQPDYKFRPPPRIDKGEEETKEAFRKHFKEELGIYEQVCIVNLVEQTGRERIIWETYSNQILSYDSSRIIYVTFDFHEYCRGMHYENVNILINAMSELINEMRFCWRDDRGVICSQAGVFRVNCIDCLDRTNVVQTAIAKYVLELQLCRLGLSAPGSGLPPSLRQAFLTMWADNGDLISRQYAGTKALKGDYTRTGERKFTGIMRDGVASANRYYLSTFKDALRQVAIDVMTGESRSIPEHLMQTTTDSPLPQTIKDQDAGPHTAAMAQHVRSLIDDCKKLLVDSEPVLGSWGLIDADPYTGDPAETEMDTVLLLTAGSYYVCEYEDACDRFSGAQQVPLAAIVSVELGTADTHAQSAWAVNVGVGAGGGRKSTDQPHCIRISYTVAGEPGYFHMLRSTQLRFFNNMAVVINSRDEMIESLHSICESILIAREVAKLPPIPFYDGIKLERRKSKVPPTLAGASGRGSRSIYMHLTQLPALPRNVSETQLVTELRNVGTKALSNMSEQFSKLNKLSHSLNSRARPNLQLKFDQGTSKTKKVFTLGQNRANAGPKPMKKKGSMSDGMSSDYSSDDECRTNIFEPTLDNYEYVQRYIGKDPKLNPETEPDCELIENPLYSAKIESHEDDKPDSPTVPKAQPSAKTPSVVKMNPFDTVDMPSMPAIQIEDVGMVKSHSSCDVKEGLSDSASYHVRSNSQCDITLNIASSHSESALKQLKNITNPMSNATDMVISPLSKFAKGVQNLGSNLDPRKMKGPPVVKQITEQQYEEHRKMQEKWRESKTRLFAL